MSFDDDVLEFACQAIERKADRVIMEKTLREIFDELEQKPSDLTLDDIAKNVADIIVRYQ